MSDIITEEMIEEALDSIMDGNDPGVEALAKLAFDLKKENDTLRKGLEIYERERNRFKHAKPEMTGAYFLTGGHGPKDDNMMPQFVEIVPAYGCGWSMVYEDTGRTISYEGS